MRSLYVAILLALAGTLSLSLVAFLAISRQIVELMGGQLALASAPGIGSTFSFELVAPLCDPTEPAIAPLPSGQTLARWKQSISREQSRSNISM